MTENIQKPAGSIVAVTGTVVQIVDLLWQQKVKRVSKSSIAYLKPAVCFTDTCFVYSDLTTSEEICQYSVTKAKSGRPSKPAVSSFSVLLFPDFSPALSVDFI